MHSLGLFMGFTWIRLRTVCMNPYLRLLRESGIPKYFTNSTEAGI